MTVDDGAVYDDYLRACREGRVEAPDAFFARHEGAGPELRSRIELLHRRLSEKTALPFQRLGEYRLLKPLDAGGMGRRAQDRSPGVAGLAQRDAALRTRGA
ncbi:MAG: hypothetical protein OER88_01925 [Planctomycetota bacterium]|nr:hypothetical protein [Planctomycetota bacterium]